MHSLNFLHRDIKPDNIMFTSNKNSNNIKLIDFGLGKFVNILNNNFTLSKAGTLPYMPP